MWNLISKIDPNWVIATLGFVYAWVRGKNQGVTNQSIQDQLMGLMRQSYELILSDPSQMDKIREKFVELANKGLEIAGIKRTTTTDLIVAAAVEKAISEVQKELDSQTRMKKTLEELFAKAGAVTVTAPKEPTVPVLGIDVVQE